MLHITDGRGVYCILGISWKDRITNVEVRTRTGQQTMDNILRERRLRWLGHVFRMDHHRIPQQALYWQVPGYKRGPGRPRVNWRGVVSKDLRKMVFTWEEAELAALDRHGWRRNVAHYVQLDTGWIKVKVKDSAPLKASIQTKMSLATAGIYRATSPPLSGAIEDCSIVRVQQQSCRMSVVCVLWWFMFSALNDSAYYMDQDYPAGPEFQQPLPEWSNRCGSELSTLETGAAHFIVVFARNEWMNL